MNIRIFYILFFATITTMYGATHAALTSPDHEITHLVTPHDIVEFTAQIIQGNFGFDKAGSDLLKEIKRKTSTSPDHDHTKRTILKTIYTFKKRIKESLEKRPNDNYESLWQSELKLQNTNECLRILKRKFFLQSTSQLARTPVRNGDALETFKKLKRTPSHILSTQEQKKSSLRSHSVEELQTPLTITHEKPHRSASCTLFTSSERTKPSQTKETCLTRKESRILLLQKCLLHLADKESDHVEQLIEEHYLNYCYCPHGFGFDEMKEKNLFIQELHKLESIREKASWLIEELKKEYEKIKTPSV